MHPLSTSEDLKLTRRRWLGSAAALAATPAWSQTPSTSPTTTTVVRAEPLPATPPQLGVYQGAGCDGRGRVPGYEAWLGRRMDRVLDGLSQVSWDSMLSTARWVTGCWQPVPVRLTLTVPMLPRDGKSTLATGATGAYDGYFRTIADRLVETGFATASIRIAPEFNASWFHWSSLSAPQTWVTYWKRIVDAMRAAPGQQFSFDWCPALYVGAKSPEPAYPGNDYVDLIGADIYNANWYPQTITPAQLWNLLLTAPVGLRWHARFAAERGKLMTYPEWATGTRPDGFGGGDDPLFITNMANWIKSNPVLYHLYWDYPASDYNGRLSDGSKPLAAAAYKQAFGGS